MQKFYPLIILLLLIALTVMYVEKPSGHFQQIEARENLIRKGKKEADSLRASLILSADTIETQRILIANANESTRRAHETAVKAQNRNNKTKAQVAELQSVIDSLAKRDTVVHILNVAYQACDSLQEAQANEIKAIGEELIATSQGLKTALNALQTSTQESDKLRQVIADTEKLTAERQKQAKKDRRKSFVRGVLIGVASVVGVILLL